MDRFEDHVSGLKQRARGLSRAEHLWMALGRSIADVERLKASLTHLRSVARDLCPAAAEELDMTIQMHFNDMMAFSIRKAIEQIMESEKARMQDK